MAATKKYQTLDLTVYPSKEHTIEVITDDGYNGAHRYRAKMCLGFDQKKQTSVYSDKTDTIQFVQKNEDGSIIPGWQSEQLVEIVLDRLVKLNEKFPHPSNEKQMKGLKDYLEACAERINERMGRNVMGELKE